MVLVMITWVGQAACIGKTENPMNAFLKILRESLRTNWRWYNSIKMNVNGDMKWTHNA